MRYKNKVHLIAIGGAAMHNLALALQYKGYGITGSDDEIYDPSRSRLAAAGLLPEKTGWYLENITDDIHTVIVGMHARSDNPELKKAVDLGLNVVSYPEFIYQESVDKIRIVIGGSHGKTSTTAMILHVMNHWQIDTDYLVGAQLEGFDRMVRLSDAPIIVIEGDEYLASPLTPVPKFHFYKPDLAILTGIAWDHINVFPTFEGYIEQFEIFIKSIVEDGTLAYFTGDKILNTIASQSGKHLNLKPYNTLKHTIENGQTTVDYRGHRNDLAIFGKHNLQNLNAARIICNELGISNKDFFEAIESFTGAAKRLQRIVKNENNVAFLDFAHAPSKVEATTNAVKVQFDNYEVVACFELHTFSSLNQEFLHQYENAMNAADIAFVYFSEHTLEMKRLPMLTKAQVKTAFNHPNMEVFTETEVLQSRLKGMNWDKKALLMMSSGNFHGVDAKAFCKELLK
jgi:UDP-N-acetylmuramate: L-alanyl-gamma-D-glutamyl-meso-diaminopimelate ligase